MRRTVSLWLISLCACNGVEANPDSMVVADVGRDAVAFDAGDGSVLEDGSFLEDSSVVEDGACGSVPASQVLDIPYATVAGVDPNLLALDIYAPARPDACKLAPAVVWVHGGGWAEGDKKNQIDDKRKLFNGLGYVLVSLNYRLSPNPPTTDPKRVMYPTHPKDVASALGWIAANVASHGGDPQRLAILGHSAGAHLVALVTTDETFLAAHGHGLSLVSCTGSFDTQGYDIPTRMATAVGTTKAIYENAFGTDPSIWAKASPMSHVTTGKKVPPFLLASRGTAARRAMCQAFADKLKGAGGKATIIDAASLSHAEVNGQIGLAGDTIMTPPVVAFLKACFAP